MATLVLKKDPAFYVATGSIMTHPQMTPAGVVLSNWAYRRLGADVEHLGLTALRPATEAEIAHSRQFAGITMEREIEVLKRLEGMISLWVLTDDARNDSVELANRFRDLVYSWHELEKYVAKTAGKPVDGSNDSAIAAAMMKQAYEVDVAEQEMSFIERAIRLLWEPLREHIVRLTSMDVLPIQSFIASMQQHPVARHGHKTTTNQEWQAAYHISEMAPVQIRAKLDREKSEEESRKAAESKAKAEKRAEEIKEDLRRKAAEDKAAAESQRLADMKAAEEKANRGFAGIFKRLKESGPEKVGAGIWVVVGYILKALEAYLPGMWAKVQAVFGHHF